MKYLLALFSFAVTFVIVSCVNTKFTFANRAIITEYNQEASTEGTISNSPQKNSPTMAAEKTTELDTAVNTSSGSTKAGDKAEKTAEDKETDTQKDTE